MQGMVKVEPSDSSSSLIGQNKEFPNLVKDSLISLDRFTRPRSSLVKKDPYQSIAGLFNPTIEEEL